MVGCNVYGCPEVAVFTVTIKGYCCVDVCSEHSTVTIEQTGYLKKPKKRGKQK